MKRKIHSALVVIFCLLAGNVKALNFTTAITHCRCAGDTTGSIKVQLTELGSQPYTYQLYSSLPFFMGGSGTLLKQVVHNNDTAIFENLSGSPTYYVYVYDNVGNTVGKAGNAVLEPAVLDAGIISIAKGLTCYSSSDGQLRANPTGGTTPYSYVWSVNTGSQTTQTAINLGQGIYSVTVNDANGCGPLNAGIFFIKNICAQGCSDSIPADITISSYTVTNACAGQSNGSIAITAGGGTSPLGSAAASTSASDSVYSATTTVSGLAADTYRSWIIDARGCKKQGSNQTVGEDPNLPVSVSIDADPSGAICSGDNVTFTATPVNGGSTPAYQWKLNGADVGSNSAVYSNSSLNDGDQVRCELTSSLRCKTGSPATSNTITISVTANTTITAEPTSQTVCAGATATFSLTASGASLSYQWQKNTGSWTNLSDSGDISGSTSNMLEIANTESSDAGSYRCLVSGQCKKDTSVIVSLTVQEAPQVTSHPSDSTICIGANASFSIAATGDGLIYQWQVDVGSGWVDIVAAGTNPTYAGWTTDTLSVNGVVAGNDGYRYRCRVTGTCTPSVTSNIATLTVNTPPSISVHPVDNTICSGQNTSFTVTASGTGLNYQWQVNIGSGWNNITEEGSLPTYGGYTTATLKLTGVALFNNGYRYRVVVSGSCTPSTTSNAATLYVGASPTIDVQPSNVTVCEGNNALFRIVVSGLTPYSYQWQKNISGIWRSLQDTGNVTGATNDTLLIVNTRLGDAGSYRCQVTNPCNTINSLTRTLAVNLKPRISVDPTSQVVCEGDSTSFSVTATGMALTYMWQLSTDGGISWSTINAAGSNPTYANWTTATLGVSSVVAGNNGYLYRSVVSGTCTPPDTSLSALLTVSLLPAISVHPVSDTVCAGSDTAFFVVTATGDGLSYQWQVNSGSGWNDIVAAGSNPTYAGWTTAVLLVNGTIASNDGYQYRCVVSGSCTPSVTSNAATLSVHFPPVISTQPANDTICENDSTTFSVSATGGALSYQWQVNSGSGWNDIVAAGSNPTYAGWTTSILSVNGVIASNDGNQYRCVVTGDCAPSATSNAGMLTVTPATAISVQPVPVTVCEGNMASFSVTAIGGNLHYQWRKNGNIIFGANDSMYTIPAVVASDTGNYDVVVTGNCGVVTSNTVTLTVNNATQITAQPVAQTQCVNGTAVFTVSATGTAPLTYQWQRYSAAWLNLVDGGDISGATSDSLQIANLDASDTANYRVVVSGACGSVTSNAVKLNLNFISAAVGTPSPFTISASTKIYVQLSVMGHGVIQDLGYHLTAPDGTTVILKKSPMADNPFAFCNFGSDASDLIFTNQRPITDTLDICSQLTPLSGTFAATGDWSVLYGKNPSEGGWALQVRDYFNDNGGVDGNLTNVSISFTDVTMLGDTVTVMFSSGTTTYPINEIGSPGRTLFQVPIGLRTKCYGSCDASAIVNVMDGTAPFTYLWSTGATTDSIGLCAGIHTVTVTDGMGCSTTATVTVTEPAEIVFTTFNFSDSLTCNGELTASITVAAAGGTGAITYSIDGINYGSSGTFTGLGGGTYTVSAKDDNGCVRDSLITIYEPAAMVIVDSLINNKCFGDSTGEIHITVNGGNPPFTYSIDGGLTYQASSSFAGLPAGTYNLAVKDAKNCSVSGTMATLTEASALLIDSIVYKDTLSCIEKTTDITIYASGGTPPYEYSIDGTATFQPSALFVSKTVGTYAIAVRDNNGCVRNMDTIQIIPANAIVINSVTIDSVTCSDSNDGKLLVNATGGTGTKMYQLIRGGNPVDFNFDGQFTGLVGGFYSVRISDEAGCDTIIGIYNVWEPLPIVYSTTKTDVTCKDFNDGTISVSITNNGGNPPYTFILFDTIPIDSNNTGLFDSLDAGVYQVQIRDRKGCILATSTMIVSNPDQLHITSVDTLRDACVGEWRITGNTTGGTSPVYFSADSGATYPFNTSFALATYGRKVFMARDINGCVSDNHVVITLDSLPVFIRLDSVVTQNVLLCNGDSSGVITVYVNAFAPPVNYNLRKIQLADSVATTHITIVPGDTVYRTIGDTVIVQSFVPFDLRMSDTLMKAGIRYIVEVNDSLLSSAYDTVFAAMDIISATAGDVIVKTDSFTLIKRYPVATQQSKTFNKVPAGRYEIVVFDTVPLTGEVCSLSRDTIHIVQPPPLIVDSVVLINDTTIVIYAHGGVGDLDYAISTKSVVPSIFSLDSLFTGIKQDSMYYVFVRDNKGCVVMSSISFKKLRVRVTTAPVSCYGYTDGKLTVDILEDGTSPYSYSFYYFKLDTMRSGKIPGAPVFDTMAIDWTVPADTIRVLIVDNGGKEFDTTVIVRQPDTISIVSSVIVPAKCKRIRDNTVDSGSISIVVAGGNGSPDFAWSNGRFSQNIDNLTTGTYTVTITDIKKCPSQQFSFDVGYTDTVWVDIPIADVSVCPGEAVTLQAEKYRMEEFRWYDLRTNTEIARNTLSVAVQPEKTTNYTIVAWNRNNCIDSKDASVTVLPKIDILPVSTDHITLISNSGRPINTRVIASMDEAYNISLYDIVILNEDAVTNYKWEVPVKGMDNASIYFGSTASDADPLFDPKEMKPNDSLRILLHVSTSAGCKEIDSFTIRMWDGFIPSGFTPNGDGINDEWQFSLGQDRYINVMVEVYNRWGEKVFMSENYEDTGPASRWNGTRNGRELPVGTYYYIITVSDKSITKQFTGPVTIIR